MFAVEVLINTLRVTLHVTREEIESALEHLCRLQLIEKAAQAGGKEVLSITDVGRRVLKNLVQASCLVALEIERDVGKSQSL